MVNLIGQLTWMKKKNQIKFIVDFHKQSPFPFVTYLLEKVSDECNAPATILAHLEYGILQ